MHTEVKVNIVCKTVSSEGILLQVAKKYVSQRLLNVKIGWVGEESPPHCSNCLPCAQTGVWSNGTQEEDLVHLHVGPNRSNTMSKLPCTVRILSTLSAQYVHVQHPSFCIATGLNAND